MRFTKNARSRVFSKLMKIIFLSRYQGKVERGVENYVAELAERLGKKHEVEILTSAWRLLASQKRSDLPRSDLGRSDLRIIYPLNGYWQTLGCRLYSWMTGAKLVVGGHAGIGRDDRWNLYMFPDLFIAFSQKGYEWAKKVNPFIKIVKIPHGVDLEKFNPKVKPSGSSSRAKRGDLTRLPRRFAPRNDGTQKAVELNLERPIFVTVSHLVPYKRVGETVRAVAKLERGSLLILGEGPMEKEIDEMGNRLLGINRYLRLKVPHNEMVKYLNACDVFTLVSEESEAFGLVYLEALACNLPVVGTDDSLRRELIGDHAAIRLSAESRRASAGVFVKNPENTREYVKALELAAKADWGDKPGNQANKFDWENIADRYLEEFMNVIVLQHKI